MTFVYSTCLLFFSFSLRLAALFNRKAKLWVLGRQRQKKEGYAWRKAIQEPVVWFHCASVGEYEQARPLIEKWKQKYTSHFILVSFFSPSGFEAKKTDPIINKALYLPLDNPRSSAQFIEQICPSVAFFIKYEFWYYYFKTLHAKKIPFYVVSAHFRPDQVFFKSIVAPFFQKILKFPTHIFVQTEESKNLLYSIQIERVTVSGDTRLERVLANKQSPFKNEIIDAFLKGGLAIVAGSIWPEDEAILNALIKDLPDHKFVLVPHEILTQNVNIWKQRYGEELVVYSEMMAGLLNPKARILYIDVMGLLSKLYRHAVFSYVGGGFGSGIHNILEAAVYEKPVLFGPKHQKFAEAEALIGLGIGFSVRNPKEALDIGHQCLTEPAVLKTAENGARIYFAKASATDIIMTTAQM